MTLLEAPLESPLGGSSILCGGEGTLEPKGELSLADGEEYPEVDEFSGLVDLPEVFKASAVVLRVLVFLAGLDGGALFFLSTEMSVCVPLFEFRKLSTLSLNLPLELTLLLDF